MFVVLHHILWTFYYKLLFEDLYMTVSWIYIGLTRRVCTLFTGGLLLYKHSVLLFTGMQRAGTYTNVLGFN